MTFFPPFLLSFSTPVWLLSEWCHQESRLFPLDLIQWYLPLWSPGGAESLVGICHQDSVPCISYHFTTEAFPFLQIKFWFTSTHFNLFPLFCFFFLGIVNSWHMPFFLSYPWKSKLREVKDFHLNCIATALVPGRQSVLACWRNQWFSFIRTGSHAHL